MVLSTGQLRNYITVQVATRTSDSQGGWTTAWTDSYYMWMKATPLSMSRTLDEGGVKYRSAVEFEGRWNNDFTLTGEHRMVWKEVGFTVYSVVYDETLRNVKVLAYV